MSAELPIIGTCAATVRERLKALAFATLVTEGYSRFFVLDNAV
ncbi:hypothetical protein NIES25_43650 [Nostoc linckia NIES-25]|nr:hypothetical protein NIES25_43650 [Nostoc linckia NIES-25]